MARQTRRRTEFDQSLGVNELEVPAILRQAEERNDDGPLVPDMSEVGGVKLSSLETAITEEGDAGIEEAAQALQGLPDYTHGVDMPDLGNSPTEEERGNIRDFIAAGAGENETHEPAFWKMRAPLEAEATDEKADALAVQAIGATVQSKSGDFDVNKLCANIQVSVELALSSDAAEDLLREAYIKDLMVKPPFWAAPELTQGLAASRLRNATKIAGDDIERIKRVMKLAGVGFAILAADEADENGNTETG